MPTTVSPLIGPRLSSNGTVHHPAPVPADVSGEVMHISPDVARDLFHKRVPNRPISKARVRVMIDDMRSGRWVFNGEPLILSADLALLDGQHRCMALAEAGVTLPMMVICGVQPDTTTVMSIDQGASKTGADMLAMHDMSNAQLLASVARWLYRYERNQMRVQKSALRHAQLPAYVESRQGIQGSLPWGRAVRDLVPAAVSAMLYFLMNVKQPVLAKAYYDNLANGVGLSREAPAYAVRERLLKDHSPRSHAGMVRRAALVVLGWNAIRSERPLPASITWKGADDSSVAFPQIV